MNMFPTSHGTIDRVVFLLYTAVASIHCLAQKPHEQVYTLRFNAPITQVQEKFIHEAVRSQDPDALVWINAAEQNALTRVHGALDRDQLQADVAASGAVITYLGRPVTDHPSAKSAAANNEVQLPVFKDTGDPARDNARYELLKQAWIEAHPTEYQQLILPQ